MDFMAATKDEKPTADYLVPRTVDPMDPAPLVKGFQRFDEKISGMIIEANHHQISDDASNNQAVEMIGQAKQLAGALEKKRKEKTEPYLFVKQTVDSHCKSIRDRIMVDIVSTLENKIRPYLQKKDRERREAERKAREEAARQQAELDLQAREAAEKAAAEAREKAKAEGLAKHEQEAAAKAAAEQVETVPVVVSESVPAETSTKTERGMAKLKTEWTWDLVDVSQLPDDIIEARFQEIVKAISPAINPRVKAGMRDIPGVKIYEKAVIQTRSRR